MKRLPSGHWVTPQLSWSRQRSCYAIQLKSDDPWIVRMLEQGYLDVDRLPEVAARAFFAMTGDIFSFCGVIASTRSSTPPKGSARVFLIDLVEAENGNAVAMVSQRDESPWTPFDIASARVPAKEALDRHKEQCEAFELDKAHRLALPQGSGPTAEEANRLWRKVSGLTEGGLRAPSAPCLNELGLKLEPVLLIDPLPADPAPRKEAVLKALNASLRPLARTGMYACMSAKTCLGHTVGLVRWTSRSEGVPAHETKAALERVFPSALKRPRQTGAAPPPNIALHSDNTEISTGTISDDPNSLDKEGELSDFLHGNPDAARERIKAGGFDAIGWYQPFHTFDRNSWGIYLDAPKLDDFAAALRQDFRVLRVGYIHSFVTYLAPRLIIAHEMFHARVDFAAAWLELACRRARYLPYSRNVYDQLRFTQDWREEALANWQTVAWAKSTLPAVASHFQLEDVEGIMRVIHDLLDLSPAGYRHWRDGQRYETWQRLASELCFSKALPQLNTTNPLPLEGLLRSNTLLDLRNEDVPLYLVGRGTVGDTLFFLPSRNEVIRVLRHFQYVLLQGRGKGSHELWRGPDNRAFPVPRRDPISNTVFKNLIDHFGWTRQQYLNEIRALI